MARLTVVGDGLVVRLSPLEKLMAFRGNVRIPVSAVETVEVQDGPLRRSPAVEAEMGFAARGAPGARVATIGPRAKYKGGRALIVVWRNGRSVVVQVGANETGYRLLVVSDRHADATAELVREASGRS